MSIGFIMGIKKQIGGRVGGATGRGSLILSAARRAAEGLEPGGCGRNS